MRRGAKIALIGLSAVGLLAVGIVAALSDRALTTRLGHAVLQRLDTQLPADVRFEHLSINPRTGEVAVDGLAVTLPGKPGEKFLAARQIILDVEMGALLTGHVRIRRVHLVNPEATIIHRGDNRYNFEEALPPQQQPEKEQKQGLFAVDRITIDGGHVTYLDDPRHLAAEVPHLDGSLDVDLDKNHAGGQITFSDGWVRYEDLKQPLDSFLADFRFTGDELALNKVKLDAGTTGLAVRGALTQLKSEAPRLRLEGDARTQLASWSRVAKAPLAGQLQATFSVRGTTQAPEVAATVSGQGLGYQDLRVEALSARLTATDERVDVRSLTAKLWNGTLRADGTVPIAKTVPLDLRATAEGLSLGAAQRQLKLTSVPPIRGSVSAQLEARGPRLAPEAITAAGWVRTEGAFPAGATRSVPPLPVKAATHFSWREAVLRLEQLDVRALGGSLTGRAQLSPLAKVPSYSAAASLRGLQLDALAALLPEPLPATGSVSGELSLQGTGFESPRLAGSAHMRAAGALKAGQAGNKHAVPLAATTRLAFAGQTIRIEQLQAQALGGTLSAHGAVGLGGRKPEINLAAEFRALDLAAANRAFAFAQGPIAGRVSARATYARDVVQLQALEARTFGGQLTASGRVALTGREPRYDLGVRARAISLAAVDRAFELTEVPVSGQANATMHVSGTGDRFRAEGPVRVAGTALVPDSVAGARRTLPFEAGGSVTVTPGAVRLAPLTARMGQSTLTARGQFELDGTTNLTFSGELLDTPAIASLFGTKGLTGGRLVLAGQAQGTGGQLRFNARAEAGATRLGSDLGFEGATLALTGSLNDRLHVSGTIDGTGFTAGGETLKTLRSPLVYDAPRRRPGAGELSLPAIEATLGTGRLAGALRVNLGTDQYTLSLKSEGLRLGDIQALHQAEGVPLGTPVRVSISGAGNLKAPQANANLDLEAFAYEGRTYGGTALNATLLNNRLSLAGQIFNGQFVVRGTVATRPEDPSDLALVFQEAQLGPLFALIPPKLRPEVEFPVAGTLTGRVQLRGPLARPERLTAEVDLSTLKLAYENIAIANEGPLQLSYANDRVAIRRFHLIGPETDLTARGTLGVGVASDFSLDGKLNLALLQTLSPKNFSAAAGTANFEGQLRGTLGAPDVTGALTIRDGELETRNLPQAIHDLNGTVRLVRNRVFLDALSANVGYTGQVQAFGGATLGEGFVPTNVNLQLSAKEIEVRVPDVRTLVSADIGFSGTPDASRLDGQVRVLEGRVTRNFDLTEQLLDRGRSGGASGGPDLMQMPFLRNLALRLSVLVPDQFYIKNNLADAELRGDLLVLGTLARPVIAGRAETVSGKITFQDRTYVLREASVDFIDPHQTTPYLHVVAGAQLQGYDITVQANGTPQQLKLDLTSSPFLPQSDILTLLATGQTPAQLGAAGGEGLATAGNFLLNQVAQGVERGVAGQGVVDVLRIQPGSVNSASTQGGNFTVGKRLTDRLMVTYTQDITVKPGETAGRVIIFDYNLTDNVVVKLEQNLGGGFNVSARYRINVR